MRLLIVEDDAPLASGLQRILEAEGHAVDVTPRGEDAVAAAAQEKFDLVILEDSRGAIPPYDALLLLAPGVAGREDLVAALAPLVGAITPGMMREANALVDRETDRRPVAEAAGWLDARIGRALAHPDGSIDGTPHPNPPPQGRRGTEEIGRSLTLPHEGDQMR